MVEECIDIAVAHALAAARAGHAQLHMIRCAVQIDVAAHRIDAAEAIAADLAAAEPQDAREYPVAMGKVCAELAVVDLAGGTAADEHRIARCARADLRADDVRTARRALAAPLLARTLLRRGHRDVHEQHTVFPVTQALLGNADVDACRVDHPLTPRHSPAPCVTRARAGE